MERRGGGEVAIFRINRLGLKREREEEGEEKEGGGEVTELWAWPVHA